MKGWAYLFLFFVAMSTMRTSCVNQNVMILFKSQVYLNPNPVYVVNDSFRFKINIAFPVDKKLSKFDSIVVSCFLTNDIKSNIYEKETIILNKEQMTTKCLEIASIYEFKLDTVDIEIKMDAYKNGKEFPTFPLEIGQIINKQ